MSGHSPRVASPHCRLAYFVKRCFTESGPDFPLSLEGRRSMPKSTLVALTLCSTLLFFTAIGQGKGPSVETSLRLDSLMTAADFKSCGLNKLSAEEMSHLNAWLQSFAVRLATTASAPEEPNATNVIESQVAGDFNGWDGETIF